MSIKQTMVAYVTYGSVGTGSLLLNDTTPGNLTDMTMTTIEQAKVEGAWLYELFPRLVESGALLLKDGHIYLHGIALTDILTMTVTLVSFTFLILKGVTDFSNTMLTRKINKFTMRQKQLESMRKRRRNQKENL